MPISVSTENNFVGGLKTEFTGLNFPENAATDADNVIFSIVGNTTRRLGFDFEVNKTLTTIDRASNAINLYKWNNAGGDGSTQVVVKQVGGTLHFYKSSASTVADPLSDQKLASTIDVTTYLVSGSSGVPHLTECTFADGNGYLFVFHPLLEPFYCTYNAGTITANQIDIQIRDFAGVVDSLDDSVRPSTLSSAHKYNIFNQGWYPGTAWTGSVTVSDSLATGVHTWTIQTGLTVSAGQIVNGTATSSGFSGKVTATFTGSVVAYNSGSGQLQLNISSTTVPSGIATWIIALTAAATGVADTFFTAAGNKYPSNVDVWWRYKNSSNVFAPGTTLSNVSQYAGPAPKGRFILSAFDQNRTAISTVPSITTITTVIRPRIGSWFQGRVWYAGTDSSFPASGTAQDTSWSETLYFSQIIEKTEQFGRCYQLNDPTSEDLFDILPSDGGTVKIQGCGKVYRLVPVQNGLLVYCSNGVWYITGSQGIGFSAVDFTVVKVSGIECSNTSSFINVQGWPVFWNDEGIYLTQSDQNGQIGVQSITISTILSFYQDIPLISKRYARGDYDPLNYVVQWCYRSANESSVTDRYEFDRILCLNLHTKAFYTYSLSGTPTIHGINYIQSPGGSTAPEPTFKYVTSYPDSGSYKFTFSEEIDTDYVDWMSYDSVGVNYDSYFKTGYKLHGQAQRRFNSGYVYLYRKANSSYKIRGIWDYGISGNSGMYTSTSPTVDLNNFSRTFGRHRIRGHGHVLQFDITSVDGEPFDIEGWSIWEIQNQSI